MGEAEYLRYHSEEFRDLAKLAKDRSRKSASSVMQLIENEGEKAALLIFLAIDLIEGASVIIHDDMKDDDEPMTKEEALGNVLGMIFSVLGKARVAKALVATTEGLKNGERIR